MTLPGPTFSAGLLYLIASVACSVAVAVFLKLARRYEIDVRQAIAANYAVTATLCALALRPSLTQIESASRSWGLLLTLGVILPSGFLAMAQSVRHAGIVRSDAAQRLSLFLPLLAAFLLFGESLTWHKAAAIILAFTALFCVLRRGTDADNARSGQHAWIWPVGVWIAYGLVDIIFKQIAKTGTAFAGALLIAFVLAGVVITGYLLVRRTAWQPRHLLAGIVLGILNFGNIVTYIRAHQSLPDNPALVFASMNMGVIVLGTVVGAIAFREPLSRLNMLGLGIAVTAIFLMMPT